MTKNKNELANKSVEELQANLLELQRQMFEYRSLQAIGKLEKTHVIRAARREKARVKTFLHQKKLSSTGVA